VEGDVHVVPKIDGAVAVQEVCFGIYISEQMSVTGKWEMQDPSAFSDAMRDNWFWLHSQRFVSVGASAVPPVISIPVSLPIRTRIGGGQALHLVMGSGQVGSTGFYVISYLRTRVRRVA